MKILLRVLHGSVTFQMKVANFNEFQLTQPFLQNSCAHHKEKILRFLTYPQKLIFQCALFG